MLFNEVAFVLASTGTAAGLTNATLLDPHPVVTVLSAAAANRSKHPIVLWYPPRLANALFAIGSAGIAATTAQLWSRENKKNTKRFKDTTGPLGT